VTSAAGVSLVTMNVAKMMVTNQSTSIRQPLPRPNQARRSGLTHRP
jgi:hypothetical protein